MTLTDLKRTFVLGFTCVCTHNARGVCAAPREVKLVQNNAVAMSGPDYGTKLGWLYWPRAQDVYIRELPNGVEIRFIKSPHILRYEWRTS